MLLILLLMPWCILLSFSMATWAGKHKRIGFWWTFFFSLTLTPLMAWVLVRLSLPAGKDHNISSLYYSIHLLISCLCLFTGIILLNAGIDKMIARGWICLLVGTGFTGMAFYLLLEATLNRQNDEE